MKRILITGIDGFFGRNLVDAWINKYELIGIDLPPQLFDQGNTAWHHSINHIDIREDPRYYKEILEGVDTVIHCAAKTRINPSWKDYADYYSTNITGSQNLLKISQEMGVKKFVHFSSSSVYGNSLKQMSENDSLAPTNPYAISKLAAELALRTQAQTGNTELLIVRPFTMYGEHMNFGTYSLAIAKFIKARIKDEPILLEGGGTQYRDFIHASDAIQALELILENGQAGETYNIGTGNHITIQELADIVTNKQIVTDHRLGPVYGTWADISKIAAFGFKPTIKVDQWLTEQIKNIKLNAL